MQKERELQKTMDSQQKRLQSVTEPLRAFTRADGRDTGNGFLFREQNREEQLRKRARILRSSGENGERPPAHAQERGR